ncbi:ATP-binding protein [Candidatus Rhodobacter oscarellae]|nr:ATP-binding protein [Candidatus Rhodobacter lobularis]
MAEIFLARRILSAKELSEAAVDRFVRWETIVGALSSVAVSAYGIIVAQMGEDAFLFVPLIYLFSAALYGTIFNHPVKPVLIARTAVYVVGFLILGGLDLFTAPPERQFLAIVVLVTSFSASFFFVINAMVFRANYVERRRREQALIQREAMLRSEIEERKNAEIAKERSETRFKSLFEGAPIPIREEDLSGIKRLVDATGLTDPDEFTAYLDAHPEFLDACATQIVVVDANRASLAQHGYADRQEMLAKVVRTLSPAAKKIVRLTAMAIHQGSPGATYETQIIRADGKRRTVTATWSVLPGYEESYARILLCSVDLTERLAAEEALRQAQKMEAVGQLTGGVAHDFNNLLTVIRGNMDLLSSTAELDPELADPILNAVQRGAELTQRLLAFSRKQPLSAQPIDLGDLVTGMAQILQRSLGDDSTISIDIHDDLWPALADPGQVEAALLNLTLNARDAMPDGGTVSYACRNATVGAENDLELEPDDYVILTVKDTGIGMSADVIKHAFEPFYTTKEVGKGSGLGLSMVYGFTKQSGGTLQIVSTPGEGAAMSLYLPRSKMALPERDRMANSEPVALGAGQTILVLEDDQDVRNYLIRLIESLGYRTLEAGDAKAAREVLRSGREIDLLVSDIMLPGGVRGPEFAAELLETAPSTKVVFVSGQPEELQSAKTDALRNAAVLSKPFTREMLAELIQRALTETG